MSLKSLKTIRSALMKITAGLMVLTLLLSTILVSDMVFPQLKAFASTVTDENSITWNYTLVDGCATNVYTTQEVTGDIVIPDALNDYPVTSLGGGSAETSVVPAGSYDSITFPNSVTAINDFAFANVNAKQILRNEDGVATALIFAGNIKTIGEKAFYKANIDTIYIPSNTVIGIGESAFEGCTVSMAYIGDGVTLALRSFAYCSNLESLYVGKCETQLAFYNLPNLKNVEVNCKRINDFINCDNIENIVLDENVELVGALSFTSEDGNTMDSAANEYVYNNGNKENYGKMPFTADDTVNWYVKNPDCQFIFSTNTNFVSNSNSHLEGSNSDTEYDVSYSAWVKYKTESEKIDKGEYEYRCYADDWNSSYVFPSTSGKSQSIITAFDDSISVTMSSPFTPSLSSKELYKKSSSTTTSCSMSFEKEEEAWTNDNWSFDDDVTVSNSSEYDYFYKDTGCTKGSSSVASTMVTQSALKGVAEAIYKDFASTMGASKSSTPTSALSVYSEKKAKTLSEIINIAKNAGFILDSNNSKIADVKKAAIHVPKADSKGETATQYSTYGITKYTDIAQIKTDYVNPNLSYCGDNESYYFGMYDSYNSFGTYKCGYSKLTYSSALSSSSQNFTAKYSVYGATKQDKTTIDTYAPCTTYVTNIAGMEDTLAGSDFASWVNDLTTVDNKMEVDDYPSYESIIKGQLDSTYGQSVLNVTASYDSVGFSKGEIDLSKLQVKVYYANGTSKTLDGNDPSVIAFISADTDKDNDYSYLTLNDTKTAPFYTHFTKNACEDVKLYNAQIFTDLSTASGVKGSKVTLNTSFSEVDKDSIGTDSITVFYIPDVTSGDLVKKGPSGGYEYCYVTEDYRTYEYVNKMHKLSNDSNGTNYPCDYKEGCYDENGNFVGIGGCYDADGTFNLYGEYIPHVYLPQSASGDKLEISVYPSEGSTYITAKLNTEYLNEHAEEYNWNAEGKYFELYEADPFYSKLDDNCFIVEKKTTEDEEGTTLKKDGKNGYSYELVQSTDTNSTGDIVVFTLNSDEKITTKLLLPVQNMNLADVLDHTGATSYTELAKAINDLEDDLADTKEDLNITTEKLSSYISTYNGILSALNKYISTTSVDETKYGYLGKQTISLRKDANDSETDSTSEIAVVWINGNAYPYETTDQTLLTNDGQTVEIYTASGDINNDGADDTITFYVTSEGVHVVKVNDDSESEYCKVYTDTIRSLQATLTAQLLEIRQTLVEISEQIDALADSLKINDESWNDLSKKEQLQKIAKAVSELIEEKAALQSQITKNNEDIASYENAVAAIYEKLVGGEIDNAKVEALKENLATILAKIESLQSDNASLNKQVVDLTERVTELNEIIATKNTQLEAAQASIKDLESTVSDLKNTVATLQNTVSEQESTIKTLETNVDSLESTNEQLGKTITSLETDVETLSSANASQQERIDSLAKNLSDAQDTIDNKTATIESLSATITSANEQIAVISAKNAEQAETIKSLDSYVDELKKENTSFAETITALNENVATLTTQNNNLSATISKLQAKITEQATTIDNLNAQITELVNSISSMETMLKKQVDEITALQSQASSYLLTLKDAIKLFGLNEGITNEQAMAALNAYIAEKTEYARVIAAIQTKLGTTATGDELVELVGQATGTSSTVVDKSSASYKAGYSAGVKDESSTSSETYKTAYKKGYKAGYSEGKSAKEDSDDEEVKDLRKEVKSLTSDLNTVSDAVDDLYANTNTSNTSLTLVGASTSDSATTITNNALRKIALLNSVYTTMSANNTTLTNTNKSLTSKVNELTTQNGNLNYAKKTLLAEKDNLKTQVDSLKSANSALTKEVNTLKNKANSSHSSHVADTSSHVVTDASTSTGKNIINDATQNANANQKPAEDTSKSVNDPFANGKTTEVNKTSDDEELKKNDEKPAQATVVNPSSTKEDDSKEAEHKNVLTAAIGGIVAVVASNPVIIIVVAVLVILAGVAFTAVSILSKRKEKLAFAEGIDEANVLEDDDEEV